jgi:leucyl/phenylalanyl-tRNA--protein transferase
MNAQGPFWIHPGDTTLAFPDVNLALREPDGLLAVGGDLAPDRILAGYRKGIFPWYGDDQPILWWSPDPRTVLFPTHFKVSRSLRRTLRKCRFRVTMDRAFECVIRACAAPRRAGSGTWITNDMAEAYKALHHRGYAHSVECWVDERLVGGIYGLAIGKIFFGESMFSRATDASKVAFAFLARQLSNWGFALIDCQVHSAHLVSLGAEQISRRAFIGYLETWCAVGNHAHAWQIEPTLTDMPW